MLLDIKQSSILTKHYVESVFKCLFKTLIGIHKEKPKGNQVATRFIQHKKLLLVFKYYIKAHAQLNQESSPCILLSDTINCSRICIYTSERDTVKTRNTGI